MTMEEVDTRSEAICRNYRGNSPILPSVPNGIFSLRRYQSYPSLRQRAHRYLAYVPIIPILRDLDDR